jgi:hypothetical protein
VILAVLLGGFTFPGSAKAAAAGVGLVQFVHASPDAPAVDIYIGADAVVPVFDNYQFGDFSYFTEVTAGTYDVAVRLAGSKPTADPVFTKKGVEIKKGVSLTLIALGLVKGGTFDMPYFTNDRSALGGKSYVNVIHASPDAPSVDILESGKPLLQGLKFGDIRNGTITPGDYTFGIAAAGTTDSLVDAKITLEPDMYYNIFAIGTKDKIQLLWTSQSAKTGYLRIMHLSPDSPAVDIYLNGTTNSLLKGITYKDITPFFELDGGAKYDIDIRPAGAAADSAPIYSVAGVNLPAGKSVSVLAIGLQAAKSFKVITLNTDRSDTKGSTRLQVIHAAPDGGPIDLLINGKVALKALSYPTDFTDTGDAGKYDIQVNVSGTSTVLLNAPGVQLDADIIYTFVAVADPSKDTGFSLISVQSQVAAH